MIIVIHGVKLYAHCYTWSGYTWSEAICSLLYMGVNLHAQCSTWSDA